MSRTVKKVALIAVVVLALILGGVIFLWMNSVPARGEFSFSERRPELAVRTSDYPPIPEPTKIQEFIEELKEKFRDEENSYLGGRYLLLKNSEDPMERAEAAEIEGWAEALERRFLKRYPEFAPYAVSHPIPDDNKTHLQYLDEASFSCPYVYREELNGLVNRDNYSSDELASEEEIKDFLDSNAERISELHRRARIQPISSIPHERNYLTSVSSYIKLLGLEARHHVRNGDLEKALYSLETSKLIIHNFIASPEITLLDLLVYWALNIQTLSDTLNCLIPEMRQEELDVDALKAAMGIEMYSPDDFAERYMRASWNDLNTYLLRALCDRKDPYYPSDPAALLDYYALNLLHVVEEASTGDSLEDWAACSDEFYNLEHEHLSSLSRVIVTESDPGHRSIIKRTKAFIFSCHRYYAAMEMLSGNPLGNDLIYNKPYRWDPETRELRFPSEPQYNSRSLKRPLSVPKLKE